MPKLDYTLSEEDGAQLQSMRKNRDPVMCFITLQMQQTIAEITKTVKASDLPEGKTTVDLLRELLTDANEFQNAPCIVVMNYVCVQKLSGAATDKVLCFKWIPDSCRGIKQKMVYSSAWEGFKTMLNSTANIGTSAMFEAQEWDGVEDKLAEM